MTLWDLGDASRLSKVKQRKRNPARDGILDRINGIKKMKRGWEISFAKTFQTRARRDCGCK